MGPQRVIGLPGETIEFRENRVIIDGRELPLRAVALSEIDPVDPVNRIGSNFFMEDGHWISFPPGAGRDRNVSSVKIGAHEYFLSGDNRDNSAASRIWGPLSERQILGSLVHHSKAIVLPRLGFGQLTLSQIALARGKRHSV